MSTLAITQNSPPPVYLDNHATTQVDSRVADAVLRTMTGSYGNSNSVDHRFGSDALALIEEAREQVAMLVGAAIDDVHFTSGATEGIQLAVRHAVALISRAGRPCRVLATSVEHLAVLDALNECATAGQVDLRLLDVDGCARLDVGQLRAALTGGVDLLCIMGANNEVGTVYPIAEIAALAAEFGVALLVDGTQSVGREPIDARGSRISYLALSAHKIFGPKGVGALVTPMPRVRRARGTTPGVGDGTPNVPGIVGLGEACRLRRAEMAYDEPRIRSHRDRLESLLVERIPGLKINGDRIARLSHNLHVSIPGVPQDAVTARLWRSVALSTGAACSSGAQSPSHVLRAMGLSASEQSGSLRMGLGRTTTQEEVDFAGNEIIRAVQEIRRTIALDE